jgi:predicted MPP superfamily phosphohydrolase/ADP-ribose pyrophosphatase YjhB (NUDIX family)
MAQPGSVTWLHLSDLHLCEPKNGDDRRRVLKTLKEDLAQLRADSRLEPDLIFITGDLAYGHLGSGKRALKSQYAEVHAFVESVRSMYPSPIPKDRIFLVPGNHDVDRRKVVPELTAWLRSRSTWKDADQLIRGGDRQWKQYAARLDAYKQFLKASGYTHLLTDPKRLIYGHEVKLGDLRIGIAGLNTAWSCSQRCEGGQIWLGRWQIDKLAAKIEETHLKIALMHHPPRSMHEYEAVKVDRDLARSFDFCLHGHEHEQYLDVVDRGPDHDNGHHRVAAGATYQDPNEENAYNIARLDFTKPQGEVWMRRYDAAGDGGWVPKVIKGRTDMGGVWRLNWSLQKVSSNFKLAGAAVTIVAPRPRTPRLSAAICVRRKDADLEILLVKTNQHRWIFPKKKPLDQEETLREIALRAAAREGGVAGKLHEQPLADFHYVKDDAMIAAFLLEVEQINKPPNPHRKRTWFSTQEAAHALMERRRFDEWAPLVAVLHEAWKRMLEDGEDADRV